MSDDRVHTDYNHCPECETRRRTAEGQKTCHRCGAALHKVTCAFSKDADAPCDCGSPAFKGKKAT